MIVDEIEENQIKTENQIKNENINNTENLNNNENENTKIDISQTYNNIKSDIDRIINEIDDEVEEAVNENNHNIIEENDVIIDGENLNNNNNRINSNESKITETHKKEKHGFTRLPLAKIKNTMKLDPDIKLCQKNAYYVVGKLTELFLQELANNAHSVAKLNKRKTMNLEDISCAVKSIEKYNFIDINSIFNVETVEDLKLKEERFEKKVQKAESKSDKKDKKSETKDKVIGNKKNKNDSNNMKIDKMFFGNNN